MFETSEEVTAAVDAVYALTVHMGRGQILTHAEIGRVLGLNPHEGRWGHVMRKVRRRLEEERGISTWPETTVGYRLCTPAEQLELPGRRLRRAMRQAKRGRKSVEALPDKSLSLHQRRLKAFMIERSRETERSLRRDVRDLTQEVKPTVTLPRRPA